MMKVDEFVHTAVDIANHYKTLYVRSGIGYRLNNSGKSRAMQNAYNRKPERMVKIMAASSDTWAFDCSGLIKSILWGWCGDSTKTYGGAVYCSNNVPDINADTLIKKCYNVDTNMNTVQKGDLLWKPGHIGIAINKEQAVECTPILADGVQITAIRNRGWQKHGKSNYVVYSYLITEGDLVRITGDYYYNSKTRIPAWVKNKIWIVKSVSGNRILIDEDISGRYHINSAVHKDDCELYD